MREARFGSGTLRLVRDGEAGVPLRVEDASGADPGLLEDAVKAAFRSAAARGQARLALRPGGLPAGEAAAVALYALAGELARGGPPAEVLVVVADDAALAAYAESLARLAPR